MRWVMQAALIMGLLHTLLRSVQAVPFPTADLKGTLAHNTVCSLMGPWVQIRFDARPAGKTSELPF